jgi:hypothetical protein
MVDKLKFIENVNKYFLKNVDKLVLILITFLKIKLTKLGFKSGFWISLF